MLKAESAGVKGAVFGQALGAELQFGGAAVEARKGNRPIDFGALGIVDEVKKEAAAALRDVEKGPFAIAHFVEDFAVVGLVSRGFGQVDQPVDSGIEEKANVMRAGQLPRENAALHESQPVIAQVRVAVGIEARVRARFVVRVAVEEGLEADFVTGRQAEAAVEQDAPKDVVGRAVHVISGKGREHFFAGLVFGDVVGVPNFASVVKAVVVGK